MIGPAHSRCREHLAADVRRSCNPGAERSRIPACGSPTLAAVIALSLPASAALRRRPQCTVTPGAPAAWTGPRRAAATRASTRRPARRAPTTSAATRCDTTLLNVDVAPSFWDTPGRRRQISARNFTASGRRLRPVRLQSNAAGDRGEMVGSSGGAAPSQESRSPSSTPAGFCSCVVVYFDVDRLAATTATPRSSPRSKLPGPTSTRRPGVQDGARQRSRPAASARTPSRTSPRARRTRTCSSAASKMYNRDPDSLAEYEFKIGTYVSFDGGRTWRDLGPARHLPAVQAPPALARTTAATRPRTRARGGTGAEDANDPRGNSDFGEEYITSDVWLQFDDEGNAYAMVLDSPPFAGGAGWGMTPAPLGDAVARGHPRPADVERPRSRSTRYTARPRATRTSPLLDDKNTFGVNNAGPDGDGKTGIMVACWGAEHAGARRRQQIVCERSTDGGRTWPGAPRAGLGARAASCVIGATSSPDTRDPNTFYVAWLAYAPAPRPARPEPRRGRQESTDGGQHWSAPVIAARSDRAAEHLPAPGASATCRSRSAARRRTATIYIDLRRLPARAAARRRGRQPGRHHDVQVDRRRGDVGRAR